MQLCVGLNKQKTPLLNQVVIGFENRYWFGQTCGRDIKMERTMKMDIQVPNASTARHRTGYGSSLVPRPTLTAADGLHHRYPRVAVM